MPSSRRQEEQRLAQRFTEIAEMESVRDEQLAALLIAITTVLSEHSHRGIFFKKVAKRVGTPYHPDGTPSTALTILPFVQRGLLQELNTLIEEIIVSLVKVTTIEMLDEISHRESSSDDKQSQ